MHRVVARFVCLAMMPAFAASVLLAPPSSAEPNVRITSQSEQILQRLLTARNHPSGGWFTNRSEFLSRQFLGTPYGADTLIGSATEPEQLVVELQRIDCFTYADYVEALKRGADRDQFLAGLTAVRYKNGVVSF